MCSCLAQIWKHGGRAFTADAGEVHPDDPMRTAMRQMMGVFAQLERSMIAARLRHGRREKASQGGYAYGPRPTGGRPRRRNSPRRSWSRLDGPAPASSGTRTSCPTERSPLILKPRASDPSAGTTGTRRPSAGYSPTRPTGRPRCGSALRGRHPRRALRDASCVKGVWLCTATSCITGNTDVVRCHSSRAQTARSQHAKRPGPRWSDQEPSLLQLPSPVVHPATGLAACAAAVPRSGRPCFSG